MPKESNFSWGDMFKLDTALPEETTEEVVVPKDTTTETEEETEEVEETEEEEEVETTENVDSNKSTVIKTEDSQLGVFAPFMGLIKEGVLSYDEEKEYENSPEGIKDLLKDNINTGVEAWKQQYPKEALEVLEHIKNGGTLNELIQIEQDGPDYEKDVDLTNEDHQKFLIADLLAEQGFSEEKIEAKLAKYEEAGLLEDEAKSAHEKLIELSKSKRVKLIEDQKKVNFERETKLKEKTESFKKKVLEITEIAGIKLKPGEAQELLDYMSKPVKEGKTRMQLEYDDDTQMKMALFMKRKFNFKDIEAKATTKATIKLKEIVSRSTDPNLKTKGAVVPREERGDENGTEIHGLPWQTIKIKK